MREGVFRGKVPEEKKAPKKTPATVAGTTVRCLAWRREIHLIMLLLWYHVFGKVARGLLNLFVKLSFRIATGATAPLC